jgi:predicted small lipoprotein YifL
MAFLMTAVLAISSCGQKGPLYLPEQDKQQNPQTVPEKKNNSEIN